MNLSKLIKEQPRQISSNLKKMKLSQRDNSLLESLLQVLRYCKSMKDLVDNYEFLDYLKRNFNNQPKLRPIVALFNLIYSSYTVDDEANVDELASILTELRSKYKNLNHMDDIEIILFAISTSFRIMQIGMEQEVNPAPPFPEVIEEFLTNVSFENVKKSFTLTALTQLLFSDYAHEHKKVMTPEGLEGKFKILQDNKNTVKKMVSNHSKIPNLSRELNVCITQYNFDDEESYLFNKILDSYKRSMLDSFGENIVNPSVITPIQVDFLPNLCSMVRYDLQNQVNFGYIDIKFNYLSFTRNLSCEMTGIMVETSIKREESDILTLKSRIGFTNKLTIDCPGFKQIAESLKLPKISNYLLKLMETDPDLDIINDYDVLAFYQTFNKTQKINQFRFLSIDERLTVFQEGNEQNTHFAITFLNEKRLTEPKALKIFYMPKFVKSTLLSDLNVSVYVTLDNDETLQYFLEDVIKVHHLKSMLRQNSTDFISTLCKNIVFYLPSCCENDEDINKWKGYSKALQLKPETNLSTIYEALEKASGIKTYDPKDPSSHLYMSCFINFEKTDVNMEKSSFSHGSFEKFDKKKMETLTLNTGISDLLDYVLMNYRNNLEGVELKDDPTDPNYNSLWRQLPMYPARVFLPSFVIIRVFEVKKLLELGEPLQFEYIDEKIKTTKEAISSQYNIVGLIAQKKRPPGSKDPIVYYPIIKEKESRFDFKYRGFLIDKEVIADMFKIDKEQVHYVIYERREVSY